MSGSPLSDSAEAKTDVAFEPGVVCLKGVLDGFSIALAAEDVEDKHGFTGCLLSAIGHVFASEYADGGYFLTSRFLYESFLKNEGKEPDLILSTASQFEKGKKVLDADRLSMDTLPHACGIDYEFDEGGWHATSELLTRIPNGPYLILKANQGASTIEHASPGILGAFAFGYFGEAGMGSEIYRLNRGIVGANHDQAWSFHKGGAVHIPMEPQTTNSCSFLAIKNIRLFSLMQQYMDENPLKPCCCLPFLSRASSRYGVYERYIRDAYQFADHIMKTELVEYQCFLVKLLVQALPRLPEGAASKLVLDMRKKLQGHKDNVMLKKSPALNKKLDEALENIEVVGLADMMKVESDNKTREACVFAHSSVADTAHRGDEPECTH